MLRWVVVCWESVPCPKCGAKAGIYCRALTTGGPTMIHKARWAAARQAAVSRDALKAASRAIWMANDRDGAWGEDDREYYDRLAKAAIGALGLRVAPLREIREAPNA